MTMIPNNGHTLPVTNDPIMPKESNIPTSRNLQVIIVIYLTFNSLTIG